MKTEFKPTAFKAITNVLGMAIEVASDGSAVRYSTTYDSDGNKWVSPSNWQAVKYDKNGVAYFIGMRSRYNLNEFMRHDTNW